LPAHIRQSAAQTAAEHFVQHPVFQASKHIACYYAFQDEMNTQAMIEAIWQAGKICYLPVVLESGLLDFVRYDKNDKLTLNQFSIPEPESKERKFPAEELDLVILPLIAFDASGHRLGTGGGYYDRTFAFTRVNSQHSPILFGFAYALQQAGCLPADTWDIQLDGVATEKEVITAQMSSR
jgi:5-formyltetrahydrofolate cyclo-ligase